MKLIKKEVFKHKNRNKLIINSLPNDITEEEENVLFDEKFFEIKDLKVKKIHEVSQERLVLTLKELYILNNGPVFCKLFYFDKLDDLGLYEDDNQYTLEEKKELANLWCRLSGKELIYQKLFKLYNLEEFEILIKFQLVTFRNVLFYFRNLHLIILGEYGYTYILSGSYNNSKITSILKKNNIDFYETKEY